ncbi:hypothetical protein PM082_022847 [Marasmius tenuissimus]|nr:hypothetical protein PM082_022847 [Marasmius tenuissimus]
MAVLATGRFKIKIHLMGQIVIHILVMSTIFKGSLRDRKQAGGRGVQEDPKNTFAGIANVTVNGIIGTMPTDSAV